MRKLLCHWGAATTVVLAGASAQAMAGGPDHFRITGITRSDSVALRAQPNAEAEVVERIPFGSKCLRNLGCQGGQATEGFATMRKGDQQRQKANQRWCQIEYQGATGWLEGRYLMENACPAAKAQADDETGAGAATPGLAAASADRHKIVFAPRQNQVKLKGRVDGEEANDYRIVVRDGQSLTVSLKASHAQTAFNVIPPHTESAMFIGTSTGNRFERTLTVDGEYRIRVYLARSAALRNASSNFGLTVKLSGGNAQPAQSGRPGTTADVSGMSAPASAGEPGENTETTIADPRDPRDPHDPQTVSFAPGQNLARLKGRLEGSETLDYRVVLEAGQGWSVTLRASHGQNYFNVLPPASESAVFIGSVSGNRFEGVAPVAGVYVVRVYLMRAAARRNATSNFGLEIARTGTAQR